MSKIFSLVVLFGSIAGTIDAEEERTISVTGTSVRQVAPDMAVWSITCADESVNLHHEGREQFITFTVENLTGSAHDDLLAGNVDVKRLTEYADWVGLLFQYANQAVLLTGDYDAQVGAFANEKAAFLHQGNWADGNIEGAGATFTRAFAPHGSMESATDGIFVAAPTYYAINSESDVIDLAKQFLNDLVYTDEGHNYMVNEAGMIPAYSTVKLSPSSPLSQSVQAWAAEGKVYSWNQYYFSEDFRNNVLAPTFNQFASGNIDKGEFVAALKAAFESL